MAFLKRIIIILVSLTILSCSSGKPINTPIEIFKTTTPIFTTSEIRLIDSWVNKALPECRFLYLKKNNHTKTLMIDIMKCVDTTFYDMIYSSHVKSLPKYLQKKLYKKPFDIYLGKKVLSHLKQLSREELTILLRHISNGFADNINFIKLLVGMGANTDDLLVSHTHSWAHNNHCDAKRYILSRNKDAYKDKTSIYKPIPIGLLNSDTGFKEKYIRNYFRKNILFNLTYNHSHSPFRCTKVLELLLNEANPLLRDVKDSYNSTPLHKFMDTFGSRIPNDLAVKLGVKLISKKNINIQDKGGETPLHKLISSVSARPDHYRAMYKELMKAGANIDLKDKKGVSVRELISIRPELKL